MASIYIGAMAALVLDAELLALQTNDKRLELARLVCSTWMTRSWTLQEGFLPPVCQILTYKRIMCLSRRAFWRIRNTNHDSDGYQIRRIGWDNVPWTSRTDDHSVEGKLISYLRSIFTDSKSFARCRVTDVDTNVGFGGYSASAADPGPDFIFSTLNNSHAEIAFVSYWNNLLARSTTKQDDLYQILANLLDLDCTQLLDSVMADLRLPAILSSLPRLPLFLLFNSGPRLNSDKYPTNKWVPISLAGDCINHCGSLEFVYSRQKPWVRLRPAANTTVLLVKRDTPRLPHEPFYVRTTQDGQTLAIHPLNIHEATESLTNNSKSICVIIDNTTTANTSFKRKRGAVLSLEYQKRSIFGKKIHLLYHYPASVQEVNPSDSAVSTQAVSASHISPFRYEMLMMCGKKCCCILVSLPYLGLTSYDRSDVFT